jgi:beta-galactosidase
VANWNWPGNENKPLEVNVYSSCEEVELLLNGKSLGRKATNRSTEYSAVWQVPYQPGELMAKGYTNGRQVSSAVLKSAGSVQRLKLTPDRGSIAANSQDLSYVTVELLDAGGVRNTVAENLINFSIQGEGTIVAVANANPMSTESYQAQQRKAWQGRCLVIVKSGKRAGRITLTASAKGLRPATVEIRTQ